MQGRKKEQATPGERAPSPQSDYFRDSDQDTMLGKKSACEEKILKGSPEAEFKKKQKQKTKTHNPNKLGSASVIRVFNSSAVS